MNSMTKSIYFAGGCFWGTEHYFKQVRGVVATGHFCSAQITVKPAIAGLP